MKILYIVDNDFWKNSQGVDFRVKNLLEGFADFETHILYVGGKVSKKNKKDIKDRYGDVFFIYPFKRKFIATIRFLLRIFKLHIPKFLQIPIKQSYFMKRKVNNIVKKNNIDILWVFYIWNNDFANIKTKVYKIMDTQDVASDFVKYKKENNIYFPSNININEEVNILNKFDLSIAVSKRDYLVFKKYLNNKVKYLPFYFEYKEISKINCKENIIGFIGGTAEFNIISLEKIIYEILPKLKTKCSLYVFGSVCEKVNYLNNESVKLIGRVGNVEEMYRQIDLAINPISFGSGLKTKCIEAMSYSTPLITTSVGAQGIESGINLAFLLADTSEEFAKKIDDFFSDKKLQKTLKENGAKFVRENFGIDKYNDLKLYLDKEIRK